MDKKLSGGGGFYNVDQAHAIISEIRQLQNSLSSGEQERQTLMQVTLTRCVPWSFIDHTQVRTVCSAAFERNIAIIPRKMVIFPLTLALIVWQVVKCRQDWRNESLLVHSYLLFLIMIKFMTVSLGSTLVEQLKCFPFPLMYHHGMVL